MIDILKENPEILKILLLDRTTGENIIWATDQYESIGKVYSKDKQILPEFVHMIKTRAEKNEESQIQRSKDNAEVFTPTWIVNAQNNIVDEEWFSRNDVFNKENTDHTFINIKPIKFDDQHTWQRYVADIRMEICCGEVPYLVNRYDAVTGKRIPLSERIGILDRKFRVINENINSDEEWIQYSEEAMKAIYGYELQGDNLFVARENLLATYVDNFKERFHKNPNEKLLKEIAEIISWNIWQMDGLKLVVPFTCHKEKINGIQLSLFDDIPQQEYEECNGCVTDNPKEHNGTRCKIMDWEKGKPILYIKLLGW